MCQVWYNVYEMQLDKCHANMQVWYNVSMRTKTMQHDHAMAVLNHEGQTSVHPHNSDQKVSKMVNKHSCQHASQRGLKLRHKQGAFYYNHHDHSWHGLSDQKQMFNAAKYTQKPADMAAPKCLKHTSMHNAHFKAQNYNTLKHGKGHKWQYKTSLHGLKYDLK